MTNTVKYHEYIYQEDMYNETTVILTHIFPPLNSLSRNQWVDPIGVLLSDLSANTVPSSNIKFLDCMHTLESWAN